MSEGNYSIKVFGKDDTELYKSIRLEALEKEAGKYGNSYAMESAFPAEHWENRIANPNGACFGLYHGHELIGLTSIIIKDATNPYEAYMTQSYIRKEHRGKKLSRLLYDARLEWAKAHLIKTLVISHRQSNIASKMANQHYGFVFTHNEHRIWPDGVREPNVFYELDI